MTWQWCVFGCWTVTVIAFVVLVIWFGEHEQIEERKEVRKKDKAA